MMLKGSPSFSHVPIQVKEECEEIAPVHQVAVRGNYVFVNFKDVEGGKSGFAKLHGR